MNLAAHAHPRGCGQYRKGRDGRQALPICSRSRRRLHPARLGVCGHWGDLAAAFFKKLALQATSTVGGAAASEAYWKRRISVAGRKMMASVVCRRLASVRRSTPADPRFLNADPLAQSLLFHHNFLTDARADPAAQVPRHTLGN